MILQTFALLKLKNNAMNVFIINGGQVFGHAGGKFNRSLNRWLTDFLLKKGIQFKNTDINNDFDADTEVDNFKWADLVIYHFPIWWFQVPNRLKKYIDEVFSAGHNNGIYASDGRSRVNPDINYGTGGLMQGKQYMVLTTWNAPETAFTLPGEFFEKRSVDEGVLFPFHKMNQFVGMHRLAGIHFHDLEKNVTNERVENYKRLFDNFLKRTFAKEGMTVCN